MQANWKNQKPPELIAEQEDTSHLTAVERHVVRILNWAQVHVRPEKVRRDPELCPARLQLELLRRE